MKKMSDYNFYYNVRESQMYLMKAFRYLFQTPIGNLDSKAESPLKLDTK